MKGIKLPKIAAHIVAAGLAAVLLLSTTYALSDFNQHKTNIFGNEGKNIDVTLNEDFDENDDWEQGETINKKVNVTNIQVPNGESVYVRLALKEYMDISHLTYTYEMDTYNNNGEPYRFLTWTKETYAPNVGLFVADEVKSVVEGWLTTYFKDKLDTSRVIGPFHNALDPDDPPAGKYYVATTIDDINGQYGKYLVNDIIPDPAKGNFDRANYPGVDLIAGKAIWDPKPDMSALADIKDFESDDGIDFEYNNFARHLWDDSDSNTYTPGDPTLHDYVQLNFATNVVPLSTWKQNPVPVKAWIYDDSTGVTEPYAYWGMPLTQGETTADFLQSVTLVKQPEGKFYYAIRVDMETVIRDQLDDLKVKAPVPDEIWNLYKGVRWGENGKNVKTDGSPLFQSTSSNNEIAEDPIRLGINYISPLTWSSNIKFSGPYAQTKDAMPTWSDNGFTQNTQIWLDPADFQLDEGFSYTSGINKSDGTHLSDRVFEIARVSDGLRVGAKGTTVELGGYTYLITSELPNTYKITQPGWYTLSVNYTHDGTDLIATASLLSEDGASLKSWPLALKPSGVSVPATDIGGARYVWFADMHVDHEIKVKYVELYNN